MLYPILRATVHSSDGKVYEQEYEKEKRCIQLNKLEKQQKRNNYFYPDPSILPNNRVFL
jgi:DNA gyrase subunit B